MSNDNKYNGWKNYETWCINLWLDNDQGSQEYWRDTTKQEIEDSLSSSDPKGGAIYSLSKLLKEGIDGRLESMDIQDGMFVDLLRASISEINFYEIAEYMVEEQIQEIV